MSFSCFAVNDINDRCTGGHLKVCTITECVHFNNIKSPGKIRLQYDHGLK